VLFANRVAERLLGGSLRTERMRLGAQRPGDTVALRRMIAETAQSNIGQSLVVERVDHAPLLVLSTPMTGHTGLSLHYANAVFLFIRDLDSRGRPELARFARHFGLTTAEAALAAELVSADGVSAAAQRLGISRATVRTQLIHIFQKTGTHRQAELVRLIVTWTEPFPQARN
jgi:DNA-binding CsgD family transcriptional regulator